MPKIYRRHCDHEPCGKYYEGSGVNYCGLKCAGAARSAEVANEQDLPLAGDGKVHVDDAARVVYISGTEYKVTPEQLW